MKVIKYIIFLLMLIPLQVSAQFYVTGDDPGRLKWSYIESDHFRIIYPNGADSLAKVYGTDLEKYSVDCINATPSRLQQYMEYAPFNKALSKCRLVMSGGEGYPISLRDAIRKCSPDIKIINTYGPTEITVSCNAADLTNAEYVSVGRPLLNYDEVIVDKFGDTAPYGVIGELYIGGVGVAKGYKNLPDKTAAAFVEYNGQRMYRSGDYAKWDKYGNVMILGRLDNQVKLRGLRIELGEIEGLMAEQPHIKKVAVVIRKLNGQDNLCAYFTADEEINIDALREELKKHLTHYMVPTAYLQMNEMPVTANGKTDIKRLPEPVPVSLGEYVAPENKTEEFFCESFKIRSFSFASRSALSTAVLLPDFPPPEPDDVFNLVSCFSILIVRW